MNRSFARRALRRCVFLLCALCTPLLLIWPTPAMEAVREALRLCGETIVPSLFPFLVLSALLTALAPMAFLQKLFAPPMGALFGLGGAGAAVLLLGFTGGYPVGVRTAAALYQKGQLSRADAEHLLSFCNNSGPGFLLGVVGVGVFHDSAAGLMLYLIHISAALAVGVVFRLTSRKHAIQRAGAHFSTSGVQSSSLPQIFSQAVTSSLSAVLNICAFVLFFMIALRLLAFTGALHLMSAAISFLLSPFGITEQLSTALIAGALEVSTGSACLQGVPLTPLTAALASFLLGWGGLSVHCQSMLFLLETDLSARPYLLGKLLQGVFSAVLAFAFFSLRM